MKKSCTIKSKDIGVYKYPIVSSVTGLQYAVKITPYGLDDSRYIEGCCVTLYKQGRFFKRQVKYNHFDNRNDKIRISSIYKPIDTDIDYSMINMARLIVELYENTIQTEINSNKKLNDDFEKFKEWNGED